MGVDTSLSDDQILEAVKSDPPTLAARRIRKDAGAVRLTFLGQTPPKQLCLHLLTMQVRNYLPRATQCNKCMRYGHVAAYSIHKKICYNCGTHHEAPDCPTSEPLCINCKGKHLATSRDCPKFRKQCRISRERSRSNTSYKEAQVKVRTKQRQRKHRQRNIQKNPRKTGIQPSGMIIRDKEQPPPFTERDFPLLEPQGHQNKQSNSVSENSNKGRSGSSQPRSGDQRMALERARNTDMTVIVIRLHFAALKAIVNACPECTALEEVQPIMKLENIVTSMAIADPQRD
ncbi:uncharacterized protein LOC135384404 [Ornithodoros turicata]|uniref:uncharacterized protein LOC135384404 n=1 Tax=Ornithodoros turicata TaxID=34597 RepID=UPI00313920D2